MGARASQCQEKDSSKIDTSGMKEADKAGLLEAVIGKYYERDNNSSYDGKQVKVSDDKGLQNMRDQVYLPTRFENRLNWKEARKEVKSVMPESVLNMMIKVAYKAYDKIGVDLKNTEGVRLNIGIKDMDKLPDAMKKVEGFLKSQGIDYKFNGNLEKMAEKDGGKFLTIMSADAGESMKMYYCINKLLGNADIKMTSTNFELIRPDGKVTVISENAVNRKDGVIEDRVIKPNAMLYENANCILNNMYLQFEGILGKDGALRLILDSPDIKSEIAKMVKSEQVSPLSEIKLIEEIKTSTNTEYYPSYFKFEITDKTTNEVKTLFLEKDGGQMTGLFLGEDKFVGNINNTINHFINERNDIISNINSFLEKIDISIPFYSVVSDSLSKVVDGEISTAEEFESAIDASFFSIPFDSRDLIYNDNLTEYVSRYFEAQDAMNFLSEIKGEI